MSNEAPNPTQFPIKETVTGKTIGTGTWRRAQVYNPATNIFSAYDQSGNPINTQYLTNSGSAKLPYRKESVNMVLQQLVSDNPYAEQIRKLVTNTYSSENWFEKTPWLSPHPKLPVRPVAFPPLAAPHHDNTQANRAFAGDCPLSPPCIPLSTMYNYINYFWNNLIQQKPRSVGELAYMQEMLVRMSRSGFVPKSFPFPPPPLPFYVTDDWRSLAPVHYMNIPDRKSKCEAQTNPAGSQHSTVMSNSESTDAMLYDAEYSRMQEFLDLVREPVAWLDRPMGLRRCDVFNEMDLWTGGSNIPKEIKITKLFGNIDCKLETKAWVVDTHRNAHTYFKKNKRCMVSYISALKESKEETHEVSTLTSRPSSK